MPAAITSSISEATLAAAVVIGTDSQFPRQKNTGEYFAGRAAAKILNRYV